MLTTKQLEMMRELRLSNDHLKWLLAQREIVHQNSVVEVANLQKAVAKARVRA